MNTAWRSIRVSTLGALVCATCAFAALRAAEPPDQKPTAPAESGPASSPGLPADSPDANAAKKAPPEDKASSARKPTRSTVKDSATIHDDPTTAPDSGESADNSVIFPADI